jgi:hypothetical protein
MVASLLVVGYVFDCCMYLLVVLVIVVCSKRRGVWWCLTKHGLGGGTIV